MYNYVGTIYLNDSIQQFSYVYKNLNVYYDFKTNDFMFSEEKLGYSTPRSKSIVQSVESFIAGISLCSPSISGGISYSRIYSFNGVVTYLLKKVSQNGKKEMYYIALGTNLNIDEYALFPNLVCFDTFMKTDIGYLFFCNNVSTKLLYAMHINDALKLEILKLFRLAIKDTSDNTYLLSSIAGVVGGFDYDTPYWRMLKV